MGSKRKHHTLEPSSVSSAPPSKKVAKSKTSSKAVERPAISHAPFLEDPKGPHLKREVELYNLLSSEDEGERLEAANAVIHGLFGSGKPADAEDEVQEVSTGVSEETLLRHLERRLMRGLASGRKGARLGFSIVITEILTQLFGQAEGETRRYPGISTGRLLGILQAKTKPDGDLSGQEERDHALGLLFGLQCFVRSSILFTEGQKGTWWKILDALILLAKKKPWIREECGFVVVEALVQMEQAIAEETLVNIQKEGLATTPEGVGIWLCAKKRFPDMRFPDKPWGSSGNPLEHLKDLAKALKESSSPEDDKKGQAVKQTGNWNPKLHFVWALVLDQYIQEAKDGDSEAEKAFEHFWKIAVDQSLFAESASAERKFWGFLLLQRMLGETASYAALLKIILSPNLVRCLINHAGKEDRFLNRAATKTLKVMVQVAEAHPGAISTLISGVVSGNGVYTFDRVTKSKTVDGMLSFATGEVAEAVVKALLKPATKASSEDERDTETRRQLFGDYLLSMIRRTDLSSDSADIAWVKNLGLPILADFAYSTKGYAAKCKPILTEKTRTLFKTRLSSAFAHVLSDSSGFLYPCEVLDNVEPDAITMDSGISDAKDSAVSIMEKLMKKIRKAGDSKSSSLKALALLYALMIFQLYNGESDALSVLDELKICYDKLVRGKDTEDNEAEASEILVEILLSLISRPSKLLRKTGQLVFEAFTDDITPEGLKLMTDVLETSESLKGQQEMFDQEDELMGDDRDHDHDHEHEQEDDDELDSDVEIIDVEEADGESDDDVEEIDDDEDDEDDEGAGEQKDTEENLRLDAALEAALGTHRADKDIQQEDSDSDADMTDSEMLELDNKLVEIFSQQKKQPNKKKEKKDARENIINFKSSILDLLEIYVKKQPAKSFELLLPLLQCIRTTTSKDSVGRKAHSVIAAFATSSKKSSEDRKSYISDKTLLVLLTAIHEEASNDASQAFAKAASTASLLVAGSIYRARKEAGKDVEKWVAKIVEIYAATRVSWMVGDKKVHASFWGEWNNWCQSVANA